MKKTDMTPQGVTATRQKQTTDTDENQKRLRLTAVVEDSSVKLKQLRTQSTTPSLTISLTNEEVTK